LLLEDTNENMSQTEISEILWSPYAYEGHTEKKKIIPQKGARLAAILMEPSVSSPCVRLPS